MLNLIKPVGFFIVVIIIFVCGCSKSSDPGKPSSLQSEGKKIVVISPDEYNSTDLPFETIGLSMRMNKGDVYSETFENGSVKVKYPDVKCSDVSLKALQLNGQDITLMSPSVTSDCMIKTKDYGNVRIGVNPLRFYLTAKQESIFHDLLVLSRINTSLGH